MKRRTFIQGSVAATAAALIPELPKLEARPLRPAAYMIWRSASDSIDYEFVTERELLFDRIRVNKPRHVLLPDLVPAAFYFRLKSYEARFGFNIHWHSKFDEFEITMIPTALRPGNRYWRVGLIKFPGETPTLDFFSGGLDSPWKYRIV